MKRIHPSGAEKRKRAEEKKKREKAEAESLPKLDKIIRVIPSSSTSSGVTSSTSSAIPTEQTEHDFEMDLAESLSEIESNIPTMEPVASTGEESSSLTRFSPDVALWNIDTDKISLQKFWTEKGI